MKMMLNLRQMPKCCLGQRATFVGHGLKKTVKAMTVKAMQPLFRINIYMQPELSI